MTLTLVCRTTGRREVIELEDRLATVTQTGALEVIETVNHKSGWWTAITVWGVPLFCAPDCRCRWRTAPMLAVS